MLSAGVGFGKSDPGGTCCWRQTGCGVHPNGRVRGSIYDVFCYLADYGCEGHRAVVGGVITCSFLEDGHHPCVLPCVLPCAVEYVSIEGLVDEDSNGQAEVVREFLQDSGWNLVRSCCFLKVQVPQELMDSRF